MFFIFNIKARQVKYLLSYFLEGGIG